VTADIALIPLNTPGSYAIDSGPLPTLADAHTNPVVGMGGGSLLMSWFSLAGQLPYGIWRLGPIGRSVSKLFLAQGIVYRHGETGIKEGRLHIDHLAELLQDKSTNNREASS
jgi:hypothetical protein